MAHVEIHEQEAEVVRRMYQRRRQGLSWAHIAAELTADGIPTPRTCGAWHWSTVQGIVTNPAYKGEGQWGRTVEYRTRNGKRSTRKRTDGRPTMPMDYPQIVDPIVWAAANERTLHQAPAVRASVEKYLLVGGMVHCTEHVHSMAGSADREGYPRYCCQRPAGGPCTKR